MPCDLQNNTLCVRSCDALFRLPPPFDCCFFCCAGMRYYVDNILSELDVPGEYYIDDAGSIYFWPPDDINLGEGYASIHRLLCVVIASPLDSTAAATGDVCERHVDIREVYSQSKRWESPTTGFPGVKTN